MGCTIVWSADGRYVEKRYDRLWSRFLDRRHDKFDQERRVGMLLRRDHPPFRHARLVGVDRRARTLRFEAVDGDPIGPKFPPQLADRDVDALIELGLAMSTYRPRARFTRRFDLARRINRAMADGLLTRRSAALLFQQADTDPPVTVFAHGDITPRNVLRSSEGPTLIDWEWAGRYPRGWELAFLWFSLIEMPPARHRVEEAVPGRDEAWFWRSALLIQLLHLSLPSLALGTEFRFNHERGRDELLERVLDRHVPQ